MACFYANMTGTYLFFKLNFVFFVDFREKK